MATAAPRNPKSNHPTTEPTIHAAFLEIAMVLWGRLTTSTTIHTTNTSDTAYRTSDGAQSWFLQTPWDRITCPLRVEGGA
jgi:hypothetical protein